MLVSEKVVGYRNWRLGVGFEFGEWLGRGLVNGELVSRMMDLAERRVTGQLAPSFISDSGIEYSG